MAITIGRAARGWFRAYCTVSLDLMRSFARIPNRTVVIAGHPNSGWSSADEGTPGSFEIEFAFEITDDGNRNFLLVYSSVDGRYAADTWHETPEGAYAAATEEFGINQSEWMK